MAKCEWDDCNNSGTLREKHDLTLCKTHLEEHEEELYWQQYYKEQGIGAYAGKKKKKKCLSQ